MSVTTSRGTKSAPSYLTSTLPQVNLLPPEVRAARGLVVTKRWLVAVLSMVLCTAAVGYTGATFSLQSAQTDLAAAQQEAAVLSTEEARYADVPVVVNNLERSESSRTIAMSSEVLWKGYLDAIAAVLPVNVSIDTFAVTQGSASMAAPVPPDLLAAQGVASITFTSFATTLPDDANWLDALNSIPGFYAATMTSAGLGEDAGVVAYAVSSSVQVDLSAYSGRFAAEAGN